MYFIYLLYFVSPGVECRHHEDRECCLLWLLQYLLNTWNSFWPSMDANKYVLDELMLFFTESLLLYILYAELWM